MMRPAAPTRGGIHTPVCGSKTSEGPGEDAPRRKGPPTDTVDAGKTEAHRSRSRPAGRN